MNGEMPRAHSLTHRVVHSSPLSILVERPGHHTGRTPRRCTATDPLIRLITVDGFTRMDSVCSTASSTPRWAPLSPSTTTCHCTLKRRFHSERAARPDIVLLQGHSLDRDLLYRRTSARSQPRWSITSRCGSGELAMPLFSTPVSDTSLCQGGVGGANPSDRRASRVDRIHTEA